MRVSMVLIPILIHRRWGWVVFWYPMVGRVMWGRMRGVNGGGWGTDDSKAVGVGNRGLKMADKLTVGPEFLVGVSQVVDER